MVQAKKKVVTKKKKVAESKKMIPKPVEREPERDLCSEVDSLIQQAISEPMYSWLVGLDSPGPTPRDAGYYRFLYLAAKYFKFWKMVDLGTCEGVSAMCMAKGNPNGRVLSVDVKDKLDKRCAMENVDYYKGDALNNDLKDSDRESELLYIDIEHTPETMESAFKIYSPYVVKGGIIVLDGVLWKGASDKMPEWWENFNPKGYEKITSLELHSLEGAGTGILIKK